MTAVPGLKSEQRLHVSDYFDNFMLQPRNASEQVIVTCGPKELALNVDWHDGFPPSDYYDLVGHVVSAGVKVPDDVARTAASKCTKQAFNDKYKAAVVISNGISFECSSYGGGAQITIIPANKARPN